MPISKRQQLLDRAQATTRRPQPGRLGPRTTTRGYRVIGISLYVDQADWLDAQVAAARAAGRHKTSRSSVVQDLIDADRRSRRAS